MYKNRNWEFEWMCPCLLCILFVHVPVYMYFLFESASSSLTDDGAFYT